MIVLAIAGAYYLFRPGDDPSQIKALFDEMTEASGSKDIDGTMEGFSFQYKDRYGVSYPVLKKLIGDAYKKFDRIEASYSGLDAVIGEDVNGTNIASVNVDVVVKGIKSDDTQWLIGSEDSPDNITVTLEKSTLGGWKITEVEGVDEP